MYWRLYGPYKIEELIANGTIMPNANRIENNFDPGRIKYISG